MDINKVLNQEIPVVFNLMLAELFKGTKGILVVQETEETYDLTFKLPLPKGKMYKDGVEKILSEITKWRG